MARNLLQDMVRVKKSPNLNIETREKKTALREKEKTFEKIPDQTTRQNKGSKYRIYFVALVSVVFLLFALSFLFSKAKITVTPKIEDVSVNEKLSATKDSNLSTLPFDLVVISGEESKTIEGGQEKDVAVKATGKVLIYNAFSSASQNLDIDTRLEGSNGKIYKTVKKITVPGMVGDKPGSVEVGIYGAEAGEEYNSSPLDFKIFGFKGTPKYSKFYARSKGDITGGFKGKSPVVSSLDKTTTISELKPILEEKLLKKVANQIPNGFVLFKNATFLSILDKDITLTFDKNNKVSINVKGTLYGFLFDEKKLTKKISEDVIDKYDGSEVYIPNIRDLTFSVLDKESMSFADVKNINFTLSGSLKFVWKVDEKKFVSDLLGKKKDDFNKVLAQYPSIASAELMIRPFWKSTFPEKEDSFEIIVNYP